MGPELLLTNLTSGYRRGDVLRAVTASIPAGQLTAVLGPNGAGKTTLLRSITGVTAVREGSIRCGAVQLEMLSARERARIVALVPQVSGEEAPLTVREAVMLARYARMTSRFSASAQDSRIVDEALAALGLSDAGERYCSELSGGELRRVLIAQGLAQEPQVLLLDEPTAFLDPPAQHEILALCSELAQLRKLVCIAVLHDPGLARLYAEYAVLLRAGRVVAAGATKEVMTTEMLAQTYGCSPEAAALLEMGGW
jgi:iron complex transport system ATP-binding protein